MDEETKRDNPTVLEKPVAQPPAQRHWILQGILDVLKSLVTGQVEPKGSDQLNQENQPEEQSQSANPENDTNTQVLPPKTG